MIWGRVAKRNERGVRLRRWQMGVIMSSCMNTMFRGWMGLAFRR